LGVRVFFVISGYLITTLLLEEHEHTGGINLTKFYIRRAYRILPAVFAFLIVVSVVYWRQLRWYDIAAAALYVANFDHLRPWFLGHLWSLSVEEQFYFLWPGVLRKWYRHRTTILLTVAVLAPLYTTLAYFFKIPEAGHTFPAVMDNLAAGCLLAIFAPKIPKIKPVIFVIMAVVVVLVPLQIQDSRMKTLALLFLLWPLLYLSIAGIILHVARTPYTLLNFSAIVWLGKISYSVYLWQQLFSFGPTARPWYYLVVPFVLGAASYYFVEQPTLRLRDKKKLLLPSSQQIPSLCTVPARQ
jgi:peptidoglycan/LPS O-acetylase OafA/YrhL